LPDSGYDLPAGGRLPPDELIDGASRRGSAEKAIPLYKQRAGTRSRRRDCGADSSNTAATHENVKRQSHQNPRLISSL
jgi:hypothetical protein